MRVQILSPIDRCIDIPLDANATVLDIKRHVAKITSLAASNLDIYYNSARMNDEDSLKDISSVICHVVDSQPTNENVESEAPSDYSLSLQEIMKLGYEETTASYTLMKCKFDLDKAICLLKEKQEEPKSPQAAFPVNLEETENLGAAYVSLKSKYPILFEPIPHDADINDYIKFLNDSLPEFEILDVCSLVKSFIDNEYNIYSTSRKFPSFRVGYLEYVLYWVIKSITERQVQSQSSWSMAENRFIFEMSAIGHDFRELDAVLRTDGRNKTDEHKNTIRKTLKRSWILPRFLEQFPVLPELKPGYTDEGVPIYLPDLVSQIHKKPKQIDEDRLIEEVLQNKEIFPVFRRELAKIAEKLLTTDKPQKIKNIPPQTVEEVPEIPLYMADEQPNQKFEEHQSRSNWPAEEDQLLLDKYAETMSYKGNRWDYIRRFLPKRTPKSIYSHFRILSWEIKSDKRPELTVPPAVLEEVMKNTVYSEEQKQFSELTEMVDIVEAIQVYYEQNGNWNIISRRMPQFKGGYIAYILYYVCTSLKKTRRTKTWSMAELRFLLEKRVDGVPVQDISGLLANKSPKQVDTKRTQIYTTIKQSPYLKQFAEFVGKVDKDGAIYDENGIPSYLPPLIEKFKTEIRIVE